MPRATICPTRQSPNYKRIAVTGAGGSATTAVSDESDATYVRRKANKAPMARFLLAAPSIPAGNDIATIVPGARLRQPTSRLAEARHPGDERPRQRQAEEQDRADRDRAGRARRVGNERLHLRDARRRRQGLPDRPARGPTCSACSRSA